MSRIEGWLLTQATHPCGRLWPAFDYDSAENVLCFYIPSDSRSGRVYGVEIDCESLECRCRCEDWSARIDARANRDDYSTYLELTAREKGYHYLPTITRRPRCLCKHVRAAVAWMRRHGLWSAVQTREMDLEAEYAAKPRKERKLA